MSEKKLLDPEVFNDLVKSKKIILDPEVFNDLVNDAYEKGRAAGEAAKRPTKEDILAIKDQAKRQQAIAENMDLFM